MLPFLWHKQVMFLWLIPRAIHAPKDRRTREKSWYSQKVSHSQWDRSFSKHLNLVLYFCMYAQSLSCVWLLAAPWTVAHKAPLSMEFSRQEYWSGLPFPPSGDLPTQGSNLRLLQLLHCQVGSLPLAHLGSPDTHCTYRQLNEIYSLVMLQLFHVCIIST